MLRSASTWQYLIASELIERYRRGRRGGFALPSTMYAQSHHGWQTVKVHDRDPVWSRLLASRQALGLYIFRDLRDVAFSLMHKRGLTFDELIDMKTLQKTMDNDLFWKGQTGTLIQRYEGIVREPTKAILQIAKHLRITLPQENAESLEAEFSLASNRERCRIVEENIRTQHKPGEPIPTESRDEHTQLHWNHIRTGTIGAWRDEASAAEKSQLNSMCRRWLLSNGYEVD